MTDIHSCSYYCDRPECIKAQRDELRDKVEHLVAALVGIRDSTYRHAVTLRAKADDALQTLTRGR